VLFILDIKKAPKPVPALPRKVPLWYRHGFLLLDQNNKPMRSFPNILPATCSSEMEDWLLVAIFHSDRRVQIGDIYARMPNEVVEEGLAVRLFQINTLSMRMTRFRLQAGLLPRETRSGSEAIVDGFKKLLGDHCFQENSTRRFGRDLTLQEIEKVREPNKGQFLQKSKNKNSTTKDTTKRKRSETTDESLPQSEEVLSQVPQTGAKRIRRTNGGEETVGTIVSNSSIGLLTPLASTPSYPGSEVGTPGQFSGVSPARTYDEGNRADFQTMMFPYQASTYGAEGFYGLWAGTPGLFNDFSPIENQDDGSGTEFQAGMFSNQVPDYEAGGSNDSTKDFLAAFTTEHGMGQSKNSTLLAEIHESEAAQEVEGIDETTSDIFDEFDRQHGIGKYSHYTEPAGTHDGNDFAEDNVILFKPSTRGTMVEGREPDVNHTATNTYVNNADGVGHHTVIDGSISTLLGLDYDSTFLEETGLSQPYYMGETTTTSPLLTPHTRNPAEFVPQMDDHVSHAADLVTNGPNSSVQPAMPWHYSSLLPMVPADSHTVLAAEQGVRRDQYPTMQSQNAFPSADLDLFDPNLHFDLDFTAPPGTYGYDSFDLNTTSADSAPQAVQYTMSVPGLSNEGLANHEPTVPTAGEPTTSASFVAPADAEYPTDFYDQALEYFLSNPDGTIEDHGSAPTLPAGSVASAEADVSTAIDDPELAFFLANLDATVEDNMFAHQ